MRKKISELNMLFLEEEFMLKEQFNNTFADYPRDKCVHQLFEEQALKTPDKTAVIACDKTLTYDELNKLSNKIANSLIEKGVKANDIVAFALPRNSNLIAVMFGILKSGAAYMPIDPDYPQDRTDYMVADSDAKFFITEDNLNEFISKSEESPNVEISSDNYCYCIYTSGSTGKPKGAVITHKNLNNFCNNNSTNYYQRDLFINGNCTVCTASITFDLSVFEIFISLLNNKKIVLASNDEIINTNKLSELILRHDVDILLLTPSKIQAYCASKSFCCALKQMKIIMVGAEIFPIQLYELLRNHTEATIYNGYGPTETTIGVSFGKVV